MTLPTCQELLDFLSDYLAGELPAEQRAGFDEHLRLCLDCRDYLENFRNTVQSAKAACCPITVDSIPDELVQVILRSRPTT